ncbi:4,5:9,10-diseco-3-hydroxy-5,9,17-trioxoandrosta-1(10),2-diene-4-oate hydrolase-like [Fagus crenata]
MLAVGLSVGLVTMATTWAYRASRPPPPKICGSPGGPPITAPRIKLRDGRHLAYKEHGVPAEAAKYKIIFVHGLSACRYGPVILKSLPQEFIEELGLYILSFDRPGYGESDPHPTQTLKSLALDIEELADHLELGSKFYVIGYSIGSHLVWGCLKYIPQRIAGATLLAPIINYWWQGLSPNLSTEAYYKQLSQDQWTLRVVHYIPWLTYLWNTQKWFPALSAVPGNPDIFSRNDLEIMSKKVIGPQIHKAHITQQGEFESLHRTLLVGFGNWEFSPIDLENPLPNNEGSVHLWQGDEDKLVDVKLQRFIAKKLPWIQYHELSGAGHFFPYAVGMSKVIINTLLFGEK